VARPITLLTVALTCFFLGWVSCQNFSSKSHLTTDAPEVKVETPDSEKLKGEPRLSVGTVKENVTPQEVRINSKFAVPSEEYNPFLDKRFSPLLGEARAQRLGLVATQINAINSEIQNTLESLKKLETSNSKVHLLPDGETVVRVSAFPDLGLELRKKLTSTISDIAGAEAALTIGYFIDKNQAFQGFGSKPWDISVLEKQEAESKLTYFLERYQRDEFDRVKNGESIRLNTKDYAAAQQRFGHLLRQ
jgi:hypothetical protein